MPKLTVSPAAVGPHAPLRLAKGHTRDDGCLDRPGPGHFSIAGVEFADTRVSSTQVGLFCDFNAHFRDKKHNVSWSPDIGYQQFATTFNEHVDNYKFALFDDSDDADPTDNILHLDMPSPPRELFGIEPHQCMDDEVLLPDHISVPRFTYEQLEKVARDEALK
ncbi:hypothetical protein PM082_018383 [Marasmius tenuissimus]|nr:hypothetical protein PM082_018383 [Marasmius tenuissimus]